MFVAAAAIAMTNNMPATGPHAAEEAERADAHPNHGRRRQEKYSAALDLPSFLRGRKKAAKNIEDTAPATSSSVS
jgi:hypothetical protein